MPTYYKQGTIQANGNIAYPARTPVQVLFGSNGSPANSASTSLAAGENHIGQVGGLITATASTLTGSTTPAYSTGDCIGTLLTFSNISRAIDKTGLIQQALVFTKSSQSTPIDLILFYANPSASTFTDNSAISIAAADFNKIIGVAHIVDWSSLGTPSVGQVNNLAMPFLPVTGTRNIYGVLVARGGITLTSTSDVEVRLKASVD